MISGQPIVAPGPSFGGGASTLSVAMANFVQIEAFTISYYISFNTMKCQSINGYLYRLLPYPYPLKSLIQHYLV